MAIKSILFFILLLIVWMNGAARGDERREWRIPNYSEVAGLHTYACPPLHHRSRHCRWASYDKVIDPAQYGYRNLSADNYCSIIAEHDYIRPLRNVTCVGYLNYNNTIVDAGVNDNIELRCPSHSECEWKRNDVIVSIGERYSYARKSKECSIRINNVLSIDFGQWTCIDPTKENEDEEIIAMFTLVLNYNSSPFNSVIVLSWCICVIFGVFIGLICHKKCCRKLPSSREASREADTQLPNLSINTGSIRFENKNSIRDLMWNPTEDKDTFQAPSSDHSTQHI